MMKFLINNKLYNKALIIYNEYNQLHDNILHLLALKACILDEHYDTGNQICTKLNLHGNIPIELYNKMIEFYGLFDIHKARELFDSDHKDAVSVTTMMNAYISSGQWQEALVIYDNHSEYHNDITHLMTSRDVLIWMILKKDNKSFLIFGIEITLRNRFALSLIIR